MLLFQSFCFDTKHQEEKLCLHQHVPTKQKTEKIEVMENDATYETLCYEPKYDTTEEKKSLSGKKVSVKIDGTEYPAPKSKKKPN